MVRSFMWDYNLREKMIFFAGIGNIFGSSYGYYCNHARPVISDFQEVTFFEESDVRLANPEDSKSSKLNIKPFETAWNALSVFYQQQIGYEFTRCYKAVNTAVAKPLYLSVRMWRKEEDWKKAVDLAKAEGKLIGNGGQKFITVVDDSVRRIIE
jgi:hypothetical protein